MKLETKSFTYSTARIKSKLDFAQKVIDSEVVRRCEPLVPFKTGILKGSGITGTKIGSGVIRYTAPYAKYQYYNGKNVGYGKRGRRWFQRMKSQQGQAILNAAQKILNGG